MNNKEFGTPETLAARRRNILEGRADLITLVSKGGLDHGELIDWAIEKGYCLDPAQDLGETLDEAWHFLQHAI